MAKTVKNERKPLESTLNLLFEILNNPVQNPAQLQNKLGLSNGAFYRQFDNLKNIFGLKYNQKAGKYEIPTNTYKCFKNEVFNFNDRITALLLLKYLENQPDSDLHQNIKDKLNKNSELAEIEKYLINSHTGKPSRESGKILASLCQAVISKRRVKIIYSCSKKEKIEIEMEPYRLINERYWYVKGLSILKKELRLYRLDRIESIDITQDEFEMPDDIDETGVKSPWDFGENEPEKVCIEFDKTEAYRIKKNRHHKTEFKRTTSDGKVEFMVSVSSPENMLPWILSFGRKAKVTTPKWLADKVRDEAMRIAGMYE